jgi:hypothetical protein
MFASPESKNFDAKFAKLAKFRYGFCGRNYFCVLKMNSVVLW